MSWKSGSRIMHDLITSMQEAEVETEARAKVYETIIETLEDMDCDTLADCVGEDPVFDKVLKSVHPHWFDEDIEDEDE